MNTKKGIALALSAILLLNLAGLAFRKISPIAFWIVIILSAVVAFKMLPKLKVN